MSNPLIQVDDVVREMTDEEYAEYEARIAVPSEGPTE